MEKYCEKILCEKYFQYLYLFLYCQTVFSVSQIQFQTEKGLVMDTICTPYFNLTYTANIKTKYSGFILRFSSSNYSAAEFWPNFDQYCTNLRIRKRILRI